MAADWCHPQSGVQSVVPATGFTLLAYVHPQSTSGQMGIASNGEVTTNKAGYRFYYVGTTGSERLIFELNDGVQSYQQVVYDISGSLQNGWHHVGVGVDAVGMASPRIRLYLDGNEVKSEPLTETSAWGAVQTEFTIGALIGGTTGYFNGMIDDVRVAHTPLSISEVQYARDNSSLALCEVTTVAYTYDHQNRLIARTATEEGLAGSTTETTDYFIHDGSGQSTTSARLSSDNLDQVGQIVLQLDENGNVTNRYLWGPGVDQLVADEQVTTAGTAGTVYWALTDHLGTVRDLVSYQNGAAQVPVHRSYDSFGNVTSELNPAAIDLLFGYTCRPFDEATGLQNNLNRWYDANVGRWISEDPIGFAGGDYNVYRYVRNAVNSRRDAGGLESGAYVASYTSDRFVPEPRGDNFRHIRLWFGHGYIAIDRPDGTRTNYHFSPNGYTQDTDSYPCSIPIIGTFTTDAEDAEFSRQWTNNDDRWEWNLINNCWVPVFRDFGNGMSKDDK